MRFRRFFLIDLFCATMVIGTFFGLSYFLSDRYGETIYYWIREAEVWLTVIVLLVAAGAGAYYWHHHRRKPAEVECELNDVSLRTPDDLERPADEVERVA